MKIAIIYKSLTGNTKLVAEKIKEILNTDFGGDPNYYDSLFDRVKSAISASNKIISYFYCQGKMPAVTRQRYVNLIKEHPDDKKLQVSLENFDNAMSHPDEEDLKNVEAWTKAVLEIVNAK